MPALVVFVYSKKSRRAMRGLFHVKQTPSMKWFHVKQSRAHRIAEAKIAPLQRENCSDAMNRQQTSCTIRPFQSQQDVVRPIKSVQSETRELLPEAIKDFCGAFCDFPVLISGLTTLMAKIISITNQKGGVGKTTTAINLAAALAIAEMRVLVVDTDAQANCTSGLGLPKDNARKSIYHAMILNEPITDVIVGTELENLKLVPSDRNSDRCRDRDD